MFDPTPYFANVSVRGEELLADWGWLIDLASVSVFRVTALGDLFLQDRDGAILFLDTIDGRVEPFADSANEFNGTFADRELRKRVLGTVVVRRMNELGICLQPNECYSPDRPPILGGDLSPENLRPCDAVVHFSILGQIHRRVRDVPPGTPNNIRFEDV